MIFAERFREYISLHTLYTTTFSNENIPPFRQKPEENRKPSKTYSVKSIFMPSRRKFFHNFRQNSCNFREFMLYLKRFPFGNQNAQIAQLVEQRTENPRVAGSIPALGIFCCTNIKKQQAAFSQHFRLSIKNTVSLLKLIPKRYRIFYLPKFSVLSECVRTPAHRPFLAHLPLLRIFPKLCLFC